MGVSRRRVVIGIAVALAAGCRAVEPETGWVSRPATFVGFGIPLNEIVAVADTVVAGADVRVVVSSFGSGSCMRRNGVSFTQTGALLRVEQRVLEQTGDVACTADLRRYPETLTVRFVGPGRTTIRAIGLAAASAGSQRLVLDSVERSIVVR